MKSFIISLLLVSSLSYADSTPNSRELGIELSRGKTLSQYLKNKQVSWKYLGKGMWDMSIKLEGSENKIVTWTYGLVFEQNNVQLVGCYRNGVFVDVSLRGYCSNTAMVMNLNAAE